MIFARFADVIFIAKLAIVADEAACAYGQRCGISAVPGRAAEIDQGIGDAAIFPREILLTLRLGQECQRQRFAIVVIFAPLHLRFRRGQPINNHPQRRAVDAHRQRPVYVCR